jgi:phenylpropionate dioxygenase-like ring-hydroxylating dioxygenase large terminal subunit
MYNTFANLFLRAFNRSLLKKNAYEGAPSIKARNPSLPYFINGWQAVCTVKEIESGKVVSRNFMGLDIIAWLSNEGPVVSQAHCPHLGVHLGSGGIVADGKMRCILHQRVYGYGGECTNKSFAGLRTYHVDVQLGIVFVWLDEEGRPPAWQIPDLTTDMYGMKWGTVHDKLRGIVVPAHPIEFIENGVDYHHAVVLHNMCNSGSSMTPDGEKLSVEFRRKNTDKGAINIHAFGPFIIDYNVDYVVRGETKYSRFLMLLQFNEDGSFRAHRIKLFRTDVKETFMDWIVRNIMFVFNEVKLFKAFMREDQLIMINRKYVEAPDYGPHDRYSADFRKWYSQFSSTPASGHPVKDVLTKPMASRHYPANG